MSCCRRGSANATTLGVPRRQSQSEDGWGQPGQVCVEQAGWTCYNARMNGSVFITRLVLNNYKSIAACSVPLGPRVFLAGQNRRGKEGIEPAR